MTSAVARDRYLSSALGRATTKARNARYNARRMAYRKFLVRGMQSGGCVDCGEEDYDVLEFDHVYGPKVFKVGSGSHSFVTLTQLLNEVAKCDVVCANDHRRRTRARQRVA